MHNLHNPGAAASNPGFGNEVVHIARDLDQTRSRGRLLPRPIGRVSRSALRHLLNMAFTMTADADELRDLLDTITWSISDYVESTVASVMDSDAGGAGRDTSGQSARSP